MKCILLVRVSTDRQSFDEQERELEILAKSRGYKQEDITPISYKESARKLTEEERGGLNDMKRLVETGEYDCVFAWEISRIARSKKVLFSIEDYLVSRKIQLIIKSPFIALLNDDGTINESADMQFVLFGQLAEAEMRNKMDRFKRAKKEYFAAGKYMGGKIMTGYRINENGFWEVDEEGAKLIRMIFELYNSGEYSMTGLGHELQSRGYFQNLSITNTKNRLQQILRNEIYIGKRTSNNLYPPIIDQETWDLCARRRRENRCNIKTRNKYLLTPLIRCECGASYSVNLLDGTYICRVRHNAVEKGLTHSPSIMGSVIESLAWWVALQEMHEDLASQQSDAKEVYQKQIEVIRQKLDHSDEVIRATQDRRLKLDEDFYVHGKFTQNRYEELAKKQDSIIAKERENVRKYESAIRGLEIQVEEEQTFDGILNSLKGSYDSLREGTDFDTMKMIIHRYIVEIRVFLYEGKQPNYWKKVVIKTIHDDQRLQKIKELGRKKSLDEVEKVLSNEFTVDVFHKIAYWGDPKDNNIVPMVYMERIPRKRVDKREKRKRTPTKQKQY